MASQNVQKHFKNLVENEYVLTVQNVTLCTRLLVLNELLLNVRSA